MALPEGGQRLDTDRNPIMKTMDLRLLEIFCAVYEERSFSKAGQRLSLTQPTVSSHIKTFEESLGTSLFDRLSREIRPTDAGRFLYEHGRPILDLKQDLIDRMGRFLNRLEGSLEVGASTIPGEYLLPRLIAEFQRSHPGVRTRLTIQDTSLVVQDVREGRLQVGFVGARTDEEDLEYQPMAAGVLVLAAPPQERWRRRATLDLKQLLELPFLMREPGSGTRMVFERRLAEKGVHPGDLEVVAELGSTAAIKEAIKAGIGVSYVSELAIRGELEAGSITVLAVPELDPMERVFYRVTHARRVRSPLAEAFLDLVPGAEATGR
jgi:DNA-binding transcriptional LysR family regulator